MLVIFNNNSSDLITAENAGFYDYTDEEVEKEGGEESIINNLLEKGIKIFEIRHYSF